MNDESFEFIRALFNFNSINWVNINIDGIEWRLKYKPLSIQEKIDIYNTFEDLPEKERTEAVAKEQCFRMLKKGNQDLKVEDIPLIKLMFIYEAIVRDSETKKVNLNKLYDKYKTIPLKEPSKRKESKIDSLVNIGMIIKELNMSVSDVSQLDDLSLISLLIFINEVATRESNSYEKSTANNKKR